MKAVGHHQICVWLIEIRPWLVHIGIMKPLKLGSNCDSAMEKSQGIHTQYIVIIQIVDE